MENIIWPTSRSLRTEWDGTDILAMTVMIQSDQMATILKEVVTKAVERLQKNSDEEASQRPKPHKWSKKEVLGHLIDSACNNHRRFILSLKKPDLVFEGYDQDLWVVQQKYQDAGWEDLIALWQHYNLHLAHVIHSIPEDKLSLKRNKHNLDQIAWKTISGGEPVSLGYFILDYIGHLEHHLAQVIKDYQKLTPDYQNL